MEKKYSILGLIAVITMLSSIAFATAGAPAVTLDNKGGPHWKLTGTDATLCTVVGDFRIGWIDDSGPTVKYSYVTIKNTYEKNGILNIDLNAKDYSHELNAINSAGGTAIETDVFVNFVGDPSGNPWEVGGPQPGRRSRTQ